MRYLAWLLVIPAVVAAIGFVITTSVEGWRWSVHNLVAHPLLVLYPPLGERLHDATAPAHVPDAGPDERATLDGLLDLLIAESAMDETPPPYVLVAPASVACRLSTDEAMAMVLAGITHVPPDWSPGMFRCVDPPAVHNGVLIVPSELVR